MEQNINKYLVIAYKLYADENGEEKLIEEATEERPFVFLSGFGVALTKFEETVEALDGGQEFELKLEVEDAYGEHLEERVVTLKKEIFNVNGAFDSKNVFVGAMLPLQNEDGNRFQGKVLEITDENVKIDLNHPLAGKALHFKGKVIENRPATNGEIQQMAQLLSGEGCGGCGGNCEGGCEGGCCGGC